MGFGVSNKTCWAQWGMRIGMSTKNGWARQDMGFGVSKKHVGPDRTWDSVSPENMLGPIRQGLLDSKMQIGPDRTWDSVSQQYWTQQNMGLGVSDDKTDWARQEMGLGVSRNILGPRGHGIRCFERTCWARQDIGLGVSKRHNDLGHEWGPRGLPWAPKGSKRSAIPPGSFLNTSRASPRQLLAQQ